MRYRRIQRFPRQVDMGPGLSASSKNHILTSSAGNGKWIGLGSRNVALTYHCVRPVGARSGHGKDIIIIAQL